MNLEDAIKTRINYLCKQKGYTLWELYKSSGVPKSTINALLGSEKTVLPKISTLLHICEGLGTNLKDFFNDDSFLDIIDTTEDKD